MLPITGLFENHLTVESLQRSIDFYGDVLKIPLGARWSRSERPLELKECHNAF